nr:hypothetical protein [Tanacetum cinerariifolium]
MSPENVAWDLSAPPPPPPSPPPQNPPPPPPPPQNPPPHHRHSHEHTSTIPPPPPPLNHNSFLNPLNDNSSTFSNPLIVGAVDGSAENELRAENEPSRQPKMSSNVARGHGGDGGYDDHPHPYQMPIGCGGSFRCTTLLGAKCRRKARVMVKIRTQFDLQPHMKSDRWPQIHAAIQQHLQKLYNSKKAALKERYWVPEEDRTYDVERIRHGRPSHFRDGELSYLRVPVVDPHLLLGTYYWRRILEPCEQSSIWSRLQHPPRVCPTPRMRSWSLFTEASSEGTIPVLEWRCGDDEPRDDEDGDEDGEDEDDS